MHLITKELQMYKIYFTLLIMLLTGSSLLASSQHKEAKELFTEAKCMGCHNVNDFNARQEAVNNFTKLHKSVQSCARNTNAGWFEEDNHNVSRYLNHKYYGFKQPPKLEE